MGEITKRIYVESADLQQVCNDVSLRWSSKDEGSVYIHTIHL